MPLSKDYATVRDRLIAAQAEIRSVVVQELKLLNDTFGVITMHVELKDGRFAEGSAHFRLDLTGKSAQATSPVEDAETSALGRALQWLGYSSDRPSLEEMQRAKAAADLDDEREELMSELANLMHAVEESGHELTVGELKMLSKIATLPAERLRAGIAHFDELLKGLPSRAA